MRRRFSFIEVPHEDVDLVGVIDRLALRVHQRVVHADRQDGDAGRVHVHLRRQTILAVGVRDSLARVVLPRHALVIQ